MIDGKVRYEEARKLIESGTPKGEAYKKANIAAGLYRYHDSRSQITTLKSSSVDSTQKKTRKSRSKNKIAQIEIPTTLRSEKVFVFFGTPNDVASVVRNLQ